MPLAIRTRQARAGTRAALLLWALTAAARAAAAPGMTLVPGGVADEATGLVYLHGAAGRVDAVELKSGRVRWSEAGAGRPLAIRDGRLLVEQAAADGSVRLLLRDARAHGRVRAASDPLPLPPGAGGAATFDAAVEPDAHGTVRYRWWALARAPGDAAAAGALRIDFARARIGPAPPLGRPAADAAAAPHGAMPAAWLVDDIWCALGTQPRGNVSWLMLRRQRRDGRALPALPVGPAAATVARLSSDGRLLVLATPGGTRARSLTLPWGGRGPTLPSARLVDAFAVVGGLLLVAVESPDGGRELRALELDDGRLRWSRPLWPGGATAPSR